MANAPSSKWQSLLCQVFFSAVAYVYPALLMRAIMQTGYYSKSLLPTVLCLRLDDVLTSIQCSEMY